MRISGVSCRPHSIEGEEISWVGDCPWNGGLCYGTESGTLFIPGPQGYESVPLTDEVINGAAFSGDIVAASTRNEIAFWDRRTGVKSSFEGGAHEVFATCQGFIAPLGIADLLLVTIDADGSFSWQTEHGVQDPLNCYKMAPLGEFDAGEAFVCAARNYGLIALVLSRGRIGTTIGHPFPDLDLIGVSPLQSTGFPRAAAGLASDRTLLFSRDILAERPSRFRIDSLTGKAYSLFVFNGHVFILTSDSLAILPDLASRFLDGTLLEGGVKIREWPVQAVDAYLVKNELFLIFPDEVLSYDAEELATGQGGFSRPSGVPTRLIDEGPLTAPVALDFVSTIA